MSRTAPSMSRHPRRSFGQPPSVLSSRKTAGDSAPAAFVVVQGDGSLVVGEDGSPLVLQYNRAHDLRNVVGGGAHVERASDHNASLGGWVGTRKTAYSTETIPSGVPGLDFELLVGDGGVWQLNLGDRTFSYGEQRSEALARELAMSEIDRWKADHPLRKAIVENSTDVARIQNYMPANYTAVQEGPNVAIIGWDNAGWTLEDYVIPRLQSGLISARVASRKIASEVQVGDILTDVLTHTVEYDDGLLPIEQDVEVIRLEQAQYGGGPATQWVHVRGLADGGTYRVQLFAASHHSASRKVANDIEGQATDYPEGTTAVCIQCGEPILLDQREGGGSGKDWGARPEDWVGNGGIGMDYGCADSHLNDDYGTGGHQPDLTTIRVASRVASRKLSFARTAASVSLTNVHIVDRGGLIAGGKDSSGATVQFRVTQSEMDQLASILFSDMAVNFSGVEIDSGDIVSTSARKQASNGYANDDTYGVAAHVDNEEAIYRAIQRVRSAGEYESTVREFAENFSGWLPDWVDLNGVNWDELYQREVEIRAEGKVASRKQAHRKTSGYEFGDEITTQWLNYPIADRPWSEPGVGASVVQSLDGLSSPSIVELAKALPAFDDSIDRELAFSEAALRFGFHYNDIYDAYFNHRQPKQGGRSMATASRRSRTRRPIRNQTVARQAPRRTASHGRARQARRKTSATSVPLSERQALVGQSVTLNGEPAQISGYKNDYATVRQVTRDGSLGLSAEWAWETVKRIVEEKGGAFTASRRPTARRRMASYELECYGCGKRGTTDTFGLGSSRQCPGCGSYEVHSPEAHDNWKPKAERERREVRPTARQANLHRTIAEQQVVIDSQGKALDAIARAAGIDLDVFKRQAVRQIQRMADVENPSQPVPEPSTEAPAVTTEQAATPQARTDVEDRGGAAATENVLPDDLTDLQSQETVLDEALDLNEQDPTRPVSGTTEAQDGKLTGEVRTTDPTAGPEMFPVEEDFDKTSARSFAALNLARLRMESGIVPPQDDVLLAQAIAADRKVSTAAINAEIKTLAQVVAKTKGPREAPQARPSRRLVPRAASTGSRETPSMSRGASQAQPSVMDEFDVLG